MRRLQLPKQLQMMLRCGDLLLLVNCHLIQRSCVCLVAGMVDGAGC